VRGRSNSRVRHNRHDKGKGDGDESFNQAAAVCFRAHHQRRGVRTKPGEELRFGLNDFNALSVYVMGFKKGNTFAKDGSRDMTLALISKLNEPSAPASSATGEFV
jgi:hypothetical protein